MSDSQNPAQDLRSALEPCPFCGGPAKKIDFGSRVGIKCADGHCGGTTRLALPGEDYAAMWNARAALAQPAENAKSGGLGRFGHLLKLVDRGAAENAKGGEVVADAIIAAKAREALGTWLAWPDAPRDGPRLVTNGQIESWLAGLPNRLAHPPAAEPVGLREAARTLLGDIADHPDASRRLSGKKILALSAALATPARTDDAAQAGGAVAEVCAFNRGDHVEKISGSKWRGVVVGEYSTSLTPEGYAVESDTETGSVQIYPAKALRSTSAAALHQGSGQ